MPTTRYCRFGFGSACGPGSREQMLTAQGSSDATIALDGTGDTWNEAPGAVTIPAGNWQVHIDVECPTGGGPQNEIDVNLTKRTSGCSVQTTIVNETLNINKGTTEEYSTATADPGELTFAAGELIVLTLTDGRGNQVKTLQYNGSGTSHDSRITHPSAPTSVSATVSESDAVGPADAAAIRALAVTATETDTVAPAAASLTSKLADTITETDTVGANVAVIVGMAATIDEGAGGGGGGGGTVGGGILVGV